VKEKFMDQPERKLAPPECRSAVSTAMGMGILFPSSHIQIEKLLNHVHTNLLMLKFGSHETLMFRFSQATGVMQNTTLAP
jgi:hypothetical protein